jgi:hypothetical protein
MSSGSDGSDVLDNVIFKMPEINASAAGVSVGDWISPPALYFLSTPPRNSNRVENGRIAGM